MRVNDIARIFIFILVLFLVVINFSDISSLNESLKSSETTARENWLQCIEDIQDEIISKLSDQLTDNYLVSHSSPALLIDPAYGGNVGDNLIAYGELVLLERMGFVNHTECSVIASLGKSQSCGDYNWAPEGGLVMWHGGGNWGDLWARQGLTLPRMNSFVTLVKKSRTVIGMPQSYHYNDKSSEAIDAKNWMDKIAQDVGPELSKKKMILTWRQNNSYESGKELYPLVDNRLVPDAAFMIGPLNNSETDIWLRKDKEKVDFMFLLRNDHESLHNEKRNKESVEEMLKNSSSNRTYELLDWWDRGRFYDKDSISDMPGPVLKYKVEDEGKFDYQHMFKTSLAMYAGGRVLITDRLHASILAFLLHKPHVYVDQMYGKITRTRDVAFKASEKCKNIKEMKYRIANHLEEAVKMAEELLEENFA